MASSIGEDFSLCSGRDQSQVHVDMGEIRGVINEIASAMRKVRVHYLCYQRDVVYGWECSYVLQRRFTKEVGIQTTETFVGGSIGQGNAVTTTSEVDIVLFSRDLEYDRAIEEEGYYKDILHKINRNLRRQFEDHYRLKYLIDVGIKFVFETETCTIHINLLLSPFWDSKWELFSSLVIVQQHKRWKLFPGMCKEQKDFVSKLEGLELPHSQAQRVNELIRRAKAWRIKNWEGKKKVTKPRAYLLSVLVITAYERVPDDVKEQKKFLRLAEQVQKELLQLVEEITMADDRLDLIVPGTDMEARREYSRLLPRRPRICDPVNPANNLYITGLQRDKDGRRDWAVLNDRIQDIDLCVTDSIILDIY